MEEPREGHGVLEGLRWDEPTALALRVGGTVQGVGFRPFVYRLATRRRLGGLVQNAGNCVRIEVEGPAGELAGFLRDLWREAPAAARIEDVASERLPTGGRTSFAIVPSRMEGGRESMGIPADMAICPDCLRELKDPQSRYYRYAFTSCTQCGPRYTITRHLPFDRERTAMDRFPLCEGCGREYGSALSRRFHAQATACAGCGPELFYSLRDGKPLASGEGALGQAKALLRSGGILAVMGVGGFHLACDARTEAAVGRLRLRKRRPDKPLAVMMSEKELARRCLCSPEETSALRSLAHPIVLLQPLPGGEVAPSVAPGMARLGVMLPYTALHVLLLEDEDLPCLVMTSGNHSGEPLSYRVEDALRELGDVADGFLCHTREILRPVDDSVVRVAGEGRILLRRARGFVPQSIAMPGCDPELQALAVGADVKNAFAVLRGGRIWLGPHIGDLEVPKTLDLFRQEVSWYLRELDVTPRMVVHDLHPGYRGTSYARERPEHLLPVQHHHAHIAACLLEHGVEEPVLGLACDGVGYGDDGGLWGGEALLATRSGYRRVGHLRPLRLIGGDVVVREPWRLAVSYLEATGRFEQDGAWALERMAAPDDTARRLLQVLRSRYPGFVSTSLGRFLDAAGALVLGRGVASYEGEMPMRLEAMVLEGETGAYPFAMEDGERLLLDWRPAFAALVDDLRRGEEPALVSTRLHRGLARALGQMALLLAERLEVGKVALGGGVWQNEWLLRWFLSEMAGTGLEVLVPHELPVGDGGLAAGQLAVLIARLGSGGEAVEFLEDARAVQGEALSQKG